jgi:hypothetical protein
MNVLQRTTPEKLSFSAAGRCGHPLNSHHQQMSVSVVAHPGIEPICDRSNLIKSSFAVRRFCSSVGLLLVSLW